MFGGLELKAPAQAQNREPDKEEPSKAVSGFSFLASSTEEHIHNDQDVASSEDDLGAAPEPAPHASSSGFSFLSTSIGAETTSVSVESDDPVTEARKGISATSTSGFGFMTSTPTSTVTAFAVNEAEPLEAKTDPPGNPSGFDFMTSEPPQKAPSPEPAEETSSASLFSMLSNSVGNQGSTTIDKAREDPHTSKVTSWGTPSQARVDPFSVPSSLSTSTTLPSFNKSQPVGSGLNFGGAAAKAKPTIKKRARQKKIGAGNIEVVKTPMTSSLPNPPTTAPATSLDPVERDGDDRGPLTDAHKYEDAAKTSSFSKLSIEAEDASKRAEEFLREKQSLPPQHTGRYMGHDPSKSDIEEDYGDVGNDSGSMIGGGFEPPQLPVKEDATFLQAKAAAEGAKQSNLKQPVTSERTFGGMIGGFFKRNVSGQTRGSPTPESVAKPEDKEKNDNVINLENKRSSDQSRISSKEAPIQYDGEQKEIQNVEQELRQKDFEAEIAEQQKRQNEIDAKLEEERKARQCEIEESKKKIQEETDRKRIEMEKEEEKRKTPSIMLQCLLKEFAERSQCAVESIASVRKEKAQLNKKKHDAEKQEKLATQQIAHAEKQQLHAADQEDFELADQLASAIELHEREKEEQGKILINIEELIDVLDSKGLDVVREVSDVFINIQNRLREFLSKQEDNSTKDFSEILEKFETDTKRLSAENERLTADLKNIERDEGFAAEERRELEENISDQTADMEKHREEAR